MVKVAISDAVLIAKSETMIRLDPSSLPVVRTGADGEILQIFRNYEAAHTFDTEMSSNPEHQHSEVSVPLESLNT
jgi:hypothetical protein